MTDIVLFCAVIIVPLLLVLLVMDLAAGSRPCFQTDDHTLASAGIFWDRPVRKRHHASARGVLPDAGLGGAPALTRQPCAQPDGIGSPTLHIAPNGPARLPAAV